MIVALLNQKGGVGKTTLARKLADRFPVSLLLEHADAVDLVAAAVLAGTTTKITSFHSRTGSVLPTDWV